MRTELHSTETSCLAKIGYILYGMQSTLLVTGTPLISAEQILSFQAIFFLLLYLDREWGLVL